MKYLAYGSNMLTERLANRVPSARSVTTVQLLGHVVRFHKKSKDGSGKCDLVKTGAATDVAYGVIFEISDSEIGKLDKAEGVGVGYERAEMSIFLNGATTPVSVYLADSGYIDARLSPYRWYRDLVLAGAEQHKLPQNYTAQLAAVAYDEDLNPNRPERIEALAALDAYNKSKVRERR